MRREVRVSVARAPGRGLEALYQTNSRPYLPAVRSPLAKRAGQYGKVRSVSE